MKTFRDACLRPAVLALSSFVFVLSAAADGAAPGDPLSGPGVRRVFRAPRLTRGSLNITKEQPIDFARWLWHPEMDGRDVPGEVVRFVRFRCDFRADASPLAFDVSADERYVLLLDGKIVSRGPNRGTVENWQYGSYEATLEPGAHRLEAVVWMLGGNAPLAQLSWKGGFIFKAEGTYDEQLTTGKGKWLCGEVTGVKCVGTGNSGAWGTGCAFDQTGAGFLNAQPAKWVEPKQVVRDIWNLPGEQHCGIRRVGWMLYPSQLPDQTENRVRPGAFMAASADVKGEHVWAKEETAAPAVAALNALLTRGEPFTVPAGGKIHALWDLGDYYSAYPEIRMSGGKGATVVLGWAEALWGADGFKRNRDEFIGLNLRGMRDTFRPTGGEAFYTTPWWRPGRWCELVVEAGEEPVTLTALSLVESRYPLARTSAFECDDPTLEGVQKICLRGMQMCCHEMLFDCPYYEQQMYPGDTRIQLNVLSALSGDDRMIRRAIETYDLAARDDGLVPFNYPTRGLQEGGSYTLCWLLMFVDYVMWHDAPDWLKARMPGMRHTLFGLAQYETEEGLMAPLPGWNFTDWTITNSWKEGSWAPGSLPGQKPGAIMSLFWKLALDSAATAEEAVGDYGMATYWRRKAENTGRAVAAAFWDEKSGRVADTYARDSWSEHAQALAILAGVLTPEQEERAFAAMIGDASMTPASVYFSFYPFQAMFKRGRGDLFLKRLDLWRDYVKMGLRTPLESPGKAARSDCHAWGSHPIYWLETGVAGVRPDAIGFRRVRVAPQPGSLKSVRAKVPHPQGFVEVDLAFDGKNVSGVVKTPVEGVFAWDGVERPLVVGANRID